MGKLWKVLWLLLFKCLFRGSWRPPIFHKFSALKHIFMTHYVELSLHLRQWVGWIGRWLSQHLRKSFCIHPSVMCCFICQFLFQSVNSPISLLNLQNSELIFSNFSRNTISQAGVVVEGGGALYFLPCSAKIKYLLHHWPCFWWFCFRYGQSFTF